MRVLVTGSRDWVDRLAVYRALNEVCEEFDLNLYPDEYGNTMADPGRITVVHGDCPTGADRYADDWCTGAFFEAERHPADWKKHTLDCPEWHLTLPTCKMAGFRRNAEMVRLGADLCLAFLNDCPDSKCKKPRPHASHGASQAATLAERSGIEVRRFTP